MADLITLTEFARRLGVSKQAVSIAIGRGRIQKTASGKIDCGSQSIAWEQNRRPEKDHRSRGVSAGDSRSDYLKYLTICKAFEAKLKEFQVKEKDGELISKENFNKKYLPGISILKNHIMSLPARHAHNLAALLVRTDEKLSKSKSFHKILTKRDVQQLARDIAEILDSDMRAIMKEIANAERN